MAAFISVHAGEPTDPAPDAVQALTELRAALTGARVVSGIDEAALQRLAKGLEDPGGEVAEM